MSLRRIGADQAAVELAGCEQLDPRGMTSASDLALMAAAGECFELTAGDASAVYVVHVRNGRVWVDALKGAGDADLVQLVDAALTWQSRGLEAIGLQTKRRGLVRKLQRHGYRITGWILRKELQPWC